MKRNIACWLCFDFMLNVENKGWSVSPSTLMIIETRKKKIFASDPSKSPSNTAHWKPMLIDYISIKIHSLVRKAENTLELRLLSLRCWRFYSSAENWRWKIWLKNRLARVYFKPVMSSTPNFACFSLTKILFFLIYSWNSWNLRFSSPWNKKIVYEQCEAQWAAFWLIPQRLNHQRSEKLRNWC